MDNGHLLDFLAALDQEKPQHQCFADACGLLQDRPASEFARVLSAAHLDLARALACVEDGERWTLVNARRTRLSGATFPRMLHFVDPEYPRELTSHIAVEFLLRESWGALGAAIRSRVGGHGRPLPSATLIMGLSASARLITCAVPLSTALPAASLPAAHDVPDATFDRYRFGFNTIRACEYWLRSVPATQRADSITSADFMRAAIGRGGDQRIARWLRGLGIGVLDVARVHRPEARAEQPLYWLPVSRTVHEIHRTLMLLVELSDQAPSVDRVLLACLATPASYLAEQVHAVVGTGTNLPLLYLRTAKPQGLTVDESDWLIKVGDANAQAAPSPVYGDLPPPRLDRLITEANNGLGFAAAARLATFTRSAPYISLAPPIPPAAFQTGDAIALVRQVRLTSRVTKETDLQTLIDESFVGEPRSTSEPGDDGAPGNQAGRWAYGRFKGLFAANPLERLEARRDLASCQTGPVGLQVLGNLGVAISARDLGALMESDPVAAIEAVVQAHCLANGVAPHRATPPQHEVRLFIGGARGEYRSGVVTPDWADSHAFTLDQAAALRIWRNVRNAAKVGDRSAVRDHLLEIAEITGIARWTDRIDGRLVEFTAVLPFDRFLIERVLYAAARPAGMLHRVFGGGPGRWQGMYHDLPDSGGQRIVVADPSATLQAAAEEAGALAEALAAEVIGGPSVLRSTVIRALEAGTDRPQLLHFAGHGISGLIEGDGSRVSGVLVADREAVGIDSIAAVSMPRILVTSACDVGATPPTDNGVGWATRAVARGAAYTLASGLPVSDRGALIHMMLTYGVWRNGLHLEAAVARTASLGSRPHQLREQWMDSVPPGDLRKLGARWIDNASALDIYHEMTAFLLATR